MAKCYMRFRHCEPIDHTTEAGDRAIRGSGFNTHGILSLPQQQPPLASAAASDAVFLGVKSQLFATQAGSSSSNALFFGPGF